MDRWRKETPGCCRSENSGRLRRRHCDDNILCRLSVFSLANVNMVNYLNYGPYSSFAPQYDSTWATLTKKDTDLLLR